MAGRTEFNLTGFFDGLFEGIARNTGVPAEDYSEITGGILYGTIEDALFDLILKPFPSAVVQAFTGIGMVAYSAFAEGVDPRLRKELYTWGIRSATEIFDPANFMAAKGSAEEIFEKIQNQEDVGSIIASIFRTPEELSKMFGMEEKKPKVTVTKDRVVEKVIQVPTTSESGTNYVPDEDEEEKKWRSLSA